MTIGESMDFHNREYFISRIMSDYILIDLGEQLKIYSPTKEIMYEANELVRTLRSKTDLLTDSDMYSLMLKRDLWTSEQEQHLNEDLPENLDKLKVGLYESILKSNQQALIRKYIKTTNDELSLLYNKRHAYDYITLEGYLVYVKNQFLLEKSNDIDWNYFDIHQTLVKYYEQSLSIPIIRELAHTSPWSAYWPTLKANGKIFDRTYITLEQQQLIQWSIMYDNARESQECPPESVFNDDDMFDGWLITQHKKGETYRNKKNIEDKIGKNDAGEIFVMVDTQEDAQVVNSLNDPNTRRIKKDRLKQVEKYGTVKESDLSDVKLDRMAQKNRAYINSIKGG